MSQLSLNIIPRLPYSPDNFVLHEGVKEAWYAIISGIQLNLFSSYWITADKRCGKTHFSVKIVDAALGLKKFPKLLDERSFEELLSDSAYTRDLNEDQVYVIDDADKYFMRITPGGSGPLVSFFEFLRSVRGKVVFLSTAHMNDLPCDEHIKSRLAASIIYNMNRPQNEDLYSILSQMARQRGLALKDKRLDFISKRIRRDIPYIENYLDRVSNLSNILNRSVTRPLLANAL